MRGCDEGGRVVDNFGQQLKLQMEVIDRLLELEKTINHVKEEEQHVQNALQICNNMAEQCELQEKLTAIQTELEAMKAEVRNVQRQFDQRTEAVISHYDIVD